MSCWINQAAADHPRSWCHSYSLYTVHSRPARAIALHGSALYMLEAALLHKGSRLANALKKKYCNCHSKNCDTVSRSETIDLVQIGMRNDGYLYEVLCARETWQDHSFQKLFQVRAKVKIPTSTHEMNIWFQEIIQAQSQCALKAKQSSPHK